MKVIIVGGVAGGASCAARLRRLDEKAEIIMVERGQLNVPVIGVARSAKLGDAMAGDATLFARQDYVEEAWRIVDPALQAGTPVFEYEPKTWGPKEVASVTPPGGWHNPVMK